MEMTLQLQAQGEVVSSLTLLDGSHKSIAVSTIHYTADPSHENPEVNGLLQTGALCVFVGSLIDYDQKKVRIYKTHLSDILMGKIYL